MDDNTILDLASGPGGLRYAATENGPWRSRDGGRNWQPIFGAQGIAATAVAAGPGELVLVAVPGGIGQSDDAGERSRFVLLPEPAPLIVSLVAADERTFFASSLQDGVFVSDDGGESWRPSSAGLLDHDVRAVAVSADRAVLAATSTGLFLSENEGRRWSPFGDLPRYEAIAAMASFGNGGLLAAVENQGLWRTRDGGASWVRIGLDVLPTEIEMIATSSSDERIAIASEEGSFFTNDCGETWASAFGIVAALNQ